jgi:signal transduction histidine kinase
MTTVQEAPVTTAAAPAATKILIVEDDPTNVALLEDMLFDSGYVHVKSVVDPRLAVETCKRFAPDLILLDLMMPHVDGFALLELLRSQRSEKFLPVIVLTADVNEESKRRALLAGATDFLRKPFDQTEVLLRMRLFTERRKAEEELQRKKEIAEETSAMKDRFLAMLSHELLTPLQPILLWAGVSVKDPTLNSEMQQGLEMVCRNVQLEARLISDMLDLTRITHGKLQLELKNTDVHEVLRCAIDIVQHEIEQRQINLLVDLKAADYRLSVDSARLQQVFWNLLRNACKFARQNGVISLRSANSNPDRLSIEVRDDGAGIEPQFLDKIFDAFEQGNSRREGLGLGLAISKGIIEMHGGTIHAQSEGVGKGATFKIELPIKGPVEAGPNTPQN